MYKVSNQINQNIITNGCLQIIYVNGYSIADQPRDPIKAYTEHLDIIIVFDGEITLKVFNQNRKLKSGDLFFCSRSTYSEIHTDDHAFSFARLRFIQEKLPNDSIETRFAASLLDSEIVKQMIFNHCISYVSYFETSPETMDENEAKLLHKDNLEILSILNIMMEQQHQNLEIIKNKVADNILLVDAIDLLEENLEQTPRISAIVDELGISHSYFVRTFKRYVGATPINFAQTLKINYSLSIISQKLESLSDISYLLGFTDQSHFNNVFRQHLQLTPGDAAHPN